MTPQWIYETDETGNGHRCHFDGEDWHVLVECQDGNRAASSAPFRTDAVAKARLKLGLPVYAATTPQPVDAHKSALQPAQIAAMVGGAACRNEPIYDPAAILHEAMRRRNEALGKFVHKLLPRREWALAGSVLAMFAVVALVYAL